jgi:hypothetical protein
LTFDASDPGLPLLGQPIPPAAYPQLNQAAAIRDVGLMVGADGASWAVMLEVPTTPALSSLSLPPDRAQLVRLAAGGGADTVQASHIVVGEHTLYSLNTNLPGQLSGLDLRRPGDGGHGPHFDLAGGDSLLLPSPHDDAFFYIGSEAQPPAITVARSDGSFTRQLPLPPGLTAQNVASQLRLFFSPDGSLLLSQGADGQLTAHSTTAARDWPIGTKGVDKTLGFDSRQLALLACGPGGLLRLPLDGTAPTRLDPLACDPAAIFARDGQVTYKRADGLFRVSESGGTPQRLIAPPIEQLLAIGPSGELAFSRDPALLYGGGLGDGWLDGWQFMQRGKRVSWSLDGRRLHWLENGARSDGSGELTAAMIPQAAGQGQPQLLARNVRQYSEVAPGKLLCISNAAGKGVYNRLILIDEATGSARWVVDSARQFLRIPGTQELLVQIVSGQLGYDIRRVPIPQ